MISRQGRTCLEALSWHEPWRQYLDAPGFPVPEKCVPEPPPVDTTGLLPEEEAVLDVLCDYGKASAAKVAIALKEIGYDMSSHGVRNYLVRLAERGYVTNLGRNRRIGSSLYQLTQDGYKVASTPNPAVWQREPWGA
jgi:hypothetical protein